MNDKYVLATNDDGELAIRTVQATESSSVTDTTSVITATNDGKLAVRVVGGGGDSHNKGYYATQAALEEAYPTAQAGDWAIVGSTDTVWIWDADTTAWVDSDQKGQVTSVNGRTGAVTVSEVPDQTGYSGRVLGTDGFVAGWVMPEIVQCEVMPVADDSNVNKIYEYVGTTDATYTNGFFYKNVPIYSDPSATISQTAGSGLTDLAVNATTFATQESQSGSYVFTAAMGTETLSPTSFDDIGGATFSFDTNAFLAAVRTNLSGVDMSQVSVLQVTVVSQTDAIVYAYDTNFSTLGYVYVFISDLESSWGLTIDGTFTFSTAQDINMNYAPASVVWSLNSATVDLTDYGITYTGTPVADDALTVVFTAGAVSSYVWTQVNVQPQGATGIDWATALDLPANSGLGWDCGPIYTIAGGLPDGKYEFYWQLKVTNSTNNTNAPFSVLTYKAALGIWTESGTKYCSGNFAPVIDGQWLGGNNNIPHATNIYLLWMNNSDLVICSGDNVWKTNIAAIHPDVAVPECFKLSKIVNMATGDEYTATGVVGNSNSPTYTAQVDGSLYMYPLAADPYIPTYHRNGTMTFDDNTQYFGFDSVIAVTKSAATCSEFDMALTSSNGGRYHLIIENSYETYLARVLEATGDLASAQIGIYDGHYLFIKLNTPAGTSGTLYFSVGAKGSSSEPQFSPISAPSTYSWINIEEVGGTITPSNFGHILQYTGTTDANYTNGYFYKANGTLTNVPTTIALSNYSDPDFSASVSDADAFVTALAQSMGWTTTDVKYYIEIYSGNNWTITYDIDNNNVAELNLGWTTTSNSTVLQYITAAYTGAATGLEPFTATYTYTAAHQEVTSTSWDRVDVQPGSSLPSQTGNAGKFLTTDGTDASWSNKPLVNQAPSGAGIATAPTTMSNTFVSYYNIIAYTTGTIRNFTANSAQTIIGNVEQENVNSGFSGWGATLIGVSCSATGNRAMAIGAFAGANANGAIQLNSTGSFTVNSDANTFKVANANGNFEIMDANGNLPADRLASTTGLADGNYRLRLTMASGVPTLTWVAE